MKFPSQTSEPKPEGGQSSLTLSGATFGDAGDAADKAIDANVTLAIFVLECLLRFFMRSLFDLGTADTTYSKAIAATFSAVRILAEMKHLVKAVPLPALGHKLPLSWLSSNAGFGG